MGLNTKFFQVGESQLNGNERKKHGNKQLFFGVRKIIKYEEK